MIAWWPTVADVFQGSQGCFQLTVNGSDANSLEELAAIAAQAREELREST